MYGDINTIVTNVGSKQMHQGGRSTSDVEKIALLPSRDTIYETCTFFESIMSWKMF